MKVAARRDMEMLHPTTRDEARVENIMKESVVSLSFDVDWAHEEVLADTIALLDRFGAKATFFATHDSPTLRELDRERYEIAIHPNFNPLLAGQGGTDFLRTIDAMMELYPEAKGLRAHSLTTNGFILRHAAQHGIRYESNVYIPTQLLPFRDYENLLKISMYWADGREMLVGPEFDAESVAIDRRIPGIFAFHPIHIFLNTEEPGRYTSAKERLNDPGYLLTRRNNGAVDRGSRDFLVALLERCAREDYATVRMNDLVDLHEQAHGNTVARPTARII